MATDDDSTDRRSPARTLSMSGAQFGIFLILVGGMIYVASDYFEDTARDVMRTESRDRTTLIQYGTLMNPSSRDGKESIYLWDLIEPLDPDRVVNVRCELGEPIPDVMLTAKIVENGRRCQLSLFAKDQASLEKITAEPLRATLEISLSQ